MVYIPAVFRVTEMEVFVLSQKEARRAGSGGRKGNTPASNSHIFGRRGGARVESRVALFGLKCVFFAN